MRANASETRARKMIGKPWRVHGHVAGAPARRNEISCVPPRPRGAARDERETQTRSGRGAI